jgi:hypothetical protein
MQRLLLLSSLLLLSACAGRQTRAERWRAELESSTPASEVLASAGSVTYSGPAGPTGRPVSQRAVRVPGGRSGIAIYDVSDLLMQVRDFPGPALGDLRHPDDRPDRFGDVEDPRPVFDEDLLIQLIEDHVAPGTWDDENVSITIANGKLIVRHPGR